ncbi:hypothetical protein [Nonlabens antarcticus]|uniref:hypothetical protein n=1 Tax=Nonlabens antarcticus TaxID=392714 RepID=UPI001891B7E5|nr:hypothetical protein [Nonlabens antarcticus]
MKNKKATTLFVIGITLSTLGVTVLSDYKMVQYTAMILGLIIMIYSVFVTDAEKKCQG